MKSSQPKNRITSMLALPAPDTAKLGLYKEELEKEMIKVEQVLTEGFYSCIGGQVEKRDQRLGEIEKLKNNLNALKNKNKLKENQLKRIKEIVAGHQIDEKYNEKTNILEEMQSEKLNLMNKVSKLEKNSLAQLNEYETLYEMKNQEYKNLLNIKEKLENLSKNLSIDMTKNDKISTQKLFLEFSEQDLNTELKLQKSSNFKLTDKNSRSLNLLRRTKSQQDSSITKSIRKISEINLRDKKRVEKREAVASLLESSLARSQISLKTLKCSKSKLAEIKLQLSQIFKILKTSEDEETLSPKNINFIIKSYSSLKFQEQSLSSKFQTLTEYQLEKQKQCDLIRQELTTLKSDDLNSTTPKPSKFTFNQLKSALSNQELSDSQSKFTQIQDLILQVYLKIINQINHYKKIIENIMLQMKNYEKDEDLLRSLERLENFYHVSKSSHLKNLYGKRKCLTIIDQKNGLAWQELGSRFKSTISLEKIKKLLNRNFEYVTRHKESNEVKLIGINGIAELIKLDELACIFIEGNGIDAKMIGYISSPKVMIIELNKIAGYEVNHSVKVVLDTLLEIFEKIELRVKNGKKKIIEVFDRDLEYDGVEVDELEFDELYETLKSSYIKKKSSEELSLKVNTDSSYNDKSTRSSGQLFPPTKLNKTTRPSAKPSSFDFKLPISSTRHLKVCENERMSLRYSPTFSTIIYK